jgi:YVTN family beta-propeller protein
MGAGTDISVVDLQTNAVTNISGFAGPFGIALSPDGTKAYVTNSMSGAGMTISVVDLTSNSITSTITSANFSGPVALAVSPDGTKAYVTNYAGGAGTTISVVDLGSMSVTNIGGFDAPVAITLNPEGTKAYVANQTSGTVFEVDLQTNMISQMIMGFMAPSNVVLFKSQPSPSPGNVCEQSLCQTQKEGCSEL